MLGRGMQANASVDPPTPAQLRAAFGRFPTGVTIITCVAADNRRIGLTANSLVSLSLDPPLLSWSLRLSSPNLPIFRDAKHFAVNVLAEAQVDLSRRFASPVSSKFDEGQWSEGFGGAPLLAGCAASFECEQFARHDAGDHQLFIGRVLHVIDRGLSPLVFNAGRYHLVGEIL